MKVIDLTHTINKNTPVYPGTPKPKLFSQRDMIIIENLCNLDKCPKGLFDFACLPLKFENSDGAPVRAVALV